MTKQEIAALNNEINGTSIDPRSLSLNKLLIKRKHLALLKTPLNEERINILESEINKIIVLYTVMQEIKVIYSIKLTLEQTENIFGDHLLSVRETRKKFQKYLGFTEEVFSEDVTKAAREQGFTIIGE